MFVDRKDGDQSQGGIDPHPKKKVQLKQRGRAGGRTTALFLLCAGFGLSVFAPDARTQEEFVTLSAGERYEAGWLHSTILGDGYRDLWITPIRVPVLLPDTVAGGLQAEELGGGAQTISLRFVAPDGRDFVFRSVDKDQAGGLHPDLRGTLVSRIAQDLVSSKHPAGALVAAPLLEAAGVLHVRPRLAVMADAPSLGEFRDQFAGMLGLLEERPNESANVGSFADYPRVIGTDRLFERLRESTEDQPDREAYVRARLMDILIGDWDRHPDQWRWAQVDRGDKRYWLPIPRDRDNAFSDVRGVVGIVGKALRPNVVSFSPEGDDLYGFVHNAQPIDRLILPGVSRDRWIAIAEDLQQRLPDSVLERAVDQLPPEYLPLNREDLLSTLQGRRNQLQTIASNLHHMISEYAEVDGTDEDESIRVDRRADGSVHVSLTGEEGDEPYREHTFDPQTTREIRIRSHDGDDRLTISGSGPASIIVRLIGGDDDDEFTDETSGSEVYFYDADGSNVFHRARRTRVDQREYEIQDVESVAENNAPAPRDWGSTFSKFSPTAGWLSEIGPVLGGGPVWTRYGFRRVPSARAISLTGLYAPLQTRFGVEGLYHAEWTGGRGATELGAEATSLSVTRFYGFGNETPEPLDTDDHRVWANRYSGRIEMEQRISSRWSTFAGLGVLQMDPDAADELPAPLTPAIGMRSFGSARIGVRTEFDGADSRSFPSRGVRLDASVDGHPLVWGDAEDTFVRGEAVAAMYLPFTIGLESVVAVRAGGAALAGDAPFQYAAYLGGDHTLRGYRTQRYAGDRSAFGSAELRTRLTKAHLWIARAEVGLLGLVDAGRVWNANEPASGWHSGYGGGLWFATLDRDLTAHLVYAYGERHTLSAGLGMPF